MSIQNRQVVDVRGFTTANVTLAVNPTPAALFTALQSLLLGARHPGTDARVDSAMQTLNQLADKFRALKL